MINEFLSKVCEVRNCKEPATHRYQIQVDVNRLVPFYLKENIRFVYLDLCEKDHNETVMSEEVSNP